MLENPKGERITTALLHLGQFRKRFVDDAPPLLGSWRNIYILVLGAFVLFVAVFWGLTEAYA